MSNGKIWLVGLGPGADSLMTPAAVDALSRCDVIVGYKGYIEQIGELIEGKEIVSMALGDEMERASSAVKLASEGKAVAVVSSGDAGVYGMAAPVFQHLASNGWDGENPQVEVIPGVSAMQAAASILGSPLMQDFCAISLSNLLTPWEAIRKRVEAAAQGDFVIALYNPRSRTRTWQIGEVRDILMNHRSQDTPVGIVKNAYRIGQEAFVTTLGELEDHFDSIDMFTTVVIGNSTTYLHGGRMITPRGYERNFSQNQGTFKTEA